MDQRTLFSLSRQAVDDLFPLHVLLNADGRIIAVGPTMRLILGSAMADVAFFDVFQVEKPRRIKTLKDIQRLGRKSLTITLRGQQSEALEFRCMASQMKLHNLRALRPAVTQEPFPVRFVWSSRLNRDPGNLWLRTLLMDVYATIQTNANAQVEAQVVEMSEPNV